MPAFKITPASKVIAVEKVFDQPVEEPVDISTRPDKPAELLPSKNLAVKRKSPTTCKVSLGELVPIPILESGKFPSMFT